MRGVAYRGRVLLEIGTIEDVLPIKKKEEIKIVDKKKLPVRIGLIN